MGANNSVCRIACFEKIINTMDKFERGRECLTTRSQRRVESGEHISLDRGHQGGGPGGLLHLGYAGHVVDAPKNVCCIDFLTS